MDSPFPQNADVVGVPATDVSFSVEETARLLGMSADTAAALNRPGELAALGKSLADVQDAPLANTPAALAAFTAKRSVGPTTQPVVSPGVNRWRESNNYVRHYEE